MMADTFTVRSTYYAHEILDIEEAEILTYHWHPAGVSQVTRPHLHLSSSIGDIPIATFGRSPASIRLADMHILTGRILLEDVIRLLITEFRVEPLRRDWDDALTRSSTATLRDLP